MCHLLFGPDDLLDELQTLKSMVGPFTAPESTYQLAELEAQIKGLIAEGPGATCQLAIPTGRPWRTRISEGEFEPPAKKCNTTVYAEVTGTWSTALVIDDPQKKVSKQKRRIAFTGVASTAIKVFEATSGEAVALWKMELGDANSPGCYFHTHAGSRPSFPVPRHPSLFATPMAAIGFALGELFQGAWDEAVQGTTGAPNRWRSIQKRRMKKLLEWALSEVESTTSSPWMSIKAAKPPPALFVP
ncbi:MAG: hypothetical protein R3F61_33955 [Myxococcota bacterium]